MIRAGPVPDPALIPRILRSCWRLVCPHPRVAAQLARRITFTNAVSGHAESSWYPPHTMEMVTPTHLGANRVNSPYPPYGLGQIHE